MHHPQTIKGNVISLVYSSEKSKLAKAIWLAIVVACFAIAIYMINDSYMEWQESPVSTTITTHPITVLEFPSVTVCPPRGSNTALNHLFERVKNVNFTQNERLELLKISNEVFIEIPNKNYVRQMTEFLTTDYKKKIANGLASMPEVDKNGTIILRSFEPEGSFSLDIPSDFFSKQTLKYELDLPKNIVDLVGEGELVISVENKSEVEISFTQSTLEYNNVSLNWSAAEEFCVLNGGHLASGASPYHQRRLESFISYNALTNLSIWIGERDEANDEKGIWSIGTSIGSLSIKSKWLQPKSGAKCLTSHQGKRSNHPCDQQYPSICTIPTMITLKTNTKVVFTSKNISTDAIKVRWLAQPLSQDFRKSDFQGKSASKASKTTTSRGGFKMSWQLQDSTNVNDNDSFLWKTKSHHEKNIMNAVNLACESKVQKVSQSKVWKTLLQLRWDPAILRTNSCLNESQVASVIHKTENPVRSPIVPPMRLS